MQVVHAHDGDTQEISEFPIFQGGSVWRRGLAGTTEGVGTDFSFAIVQFAAGARTKWHRHSSDQVLYVVAGIGKAGDRTAEHLISVGDCVVIPAQEDHWHGAADTGSPMSHIALTRADSTTTVSDGQ